MGRTANSGLGSVYKRGNKWRAQIVVNGERRSFTTDKKSEANAWLAKMRTDSNFGILPKKSSITVKEFSENWLENIIRPSVSEQTFRNYETAFNYHFYPDMGDIVLQELTPEMIEKSYRKTFRHNKSRDFVNSTCARFNRMLKYAVKQNVLIKNPHDKVDLRFGLKTARVKAYTKEEQELIIDYLKKNMDAKNALFYLLLASGMRIGEALALNVSDVNFKNKSVNVNKTVVYVKGGYIIQDHPKTDTSSRTLYLSDNAANYLKRYYAKYKPATYFFENRNGKFIEYGSMKYRWNCVQRDLDIPYRSIHSLRHSYATRALEKGIDIKTVSVILGHKSVVTTMDIYQDVYDGQKIKAADVLNDLF